MEKIGCTFYIFRHGETEWNVQGLLQGHEDSPLTERGILQAYVLARRFRDYSFGAAYSSDLLRVQRTAQIVADPHNLVVITDPLLRERSFGQYEGHPHQILDNGWRNLDLIPLDQQPYHKPAPDIECDAEIAERMEHFTQKVAPLHPNQNVLVGTSGSIMRAYLERIGHLEPNSWRKGRLQNGAHAVVVYDGLTFSTKELYGYAEKV